MGDEEDDSCLVMDRYEVRGIESGEAFLGEGAFSMVWKATDLQTNKEVAVKTYKADLQDEEEQKLVLEKFKNQIKVLQYLQEPLTKGNLDSKMWCDVLDKTDAKRIFLQLVDYSKDSKGNPGPYLDGSCYVVTEVADYSLKDFIRQRRDSQQPLSVDEVQQIASSIILAVAGLHAKGLVHLDFKAENIMMADGSWKLIDLDGAVKVETKLSIDDSTISFSPAYCSPEFAEFMLGDQDRIAIKCSMDVWSVGLTIVELVLLKVLVSKAHLKLLGAQKLDSGQAIVEWLIYQCPSGKLPLPPAVGGFSKEFAEIVQSLLTRDPNVRLTLAQCLGNSWWPAVRGEGDSGAQQPCRKQKFKGKESNRKLLPVFKGTLWKLNADGDPMNAEHWLKRDFWLTQTGALCYFSSKQGKSLVLVDGEDLRVCEVNMIESKNCALPNAFALEISGHGLHKEAAWFAAESNEDVNKWMDAISSARSDERKTLNVRALRAMRLRIRNARREYDPREKEYQKAFEGKLWKLDQEGDPKNEANWRLRDMWIAQNGSLCYFSAKEQKGLEYHSAADIQRAEVRELGDAEACKPCAFEIKLGAKDGMEFDPSVFAAQTGAERTLWVQKLRQLRSVKGPEKAAPKKGGRLSMAGARVR